jgi:hypothetical protein
MSGLSYSAKKLCETLQIVSGVCARMNLLVRDNEKQTEMISL